MLAPSRACLECRIRIASWQWRCHGEPPASQRLTTLFFKHVILKSVKDLLVAVEKADPSLRSG